MPIGVHLPGPLARGAEQQGAQGGRGSGRRRRHAREAMGGGAASSRRTLATAPAARAPPRARRGQFPAGRLDPGEARAEAARPKLRQGGVHLPEGGAELGGHGGPRVAREGVGQREAALDENKIKNISTNV